MTDIILIPGLWLDGSSWDAVVPTLREAGHAAHPVTLPGMEARDADRSAVTLADVVDAVTSLVDAAEDRPVVVGHSGGAGVATAVADARADRIARLIYIGGFPARDGRPIMQGFPVTDHGIELPPWDEFDDADLTDLDEAGREQFRNRAIPSPGCLATETLHLSDPRRYEIPTTTICPEYTSDQLREWIAAGEGPVAEFARISDLEFVDVPTGHWPQFTRPVELGRAIADAAASSATSSASSAPSERP